MIFVRRLSTFLALCALLASFENGLAREVSSPEELCVAVAGRFEAGGEDENAFDLCRFGSAVLSADTLWKFYEAFDGDRWPEAIDAFAQRHFGKGGWESPGLVCRFFEGDVLRVAHRDFCVFRDDSIIGLDTLFKGVNDKENSGLKRALQWTMGGE